MATPGERNRREHKPGRDPLYNPQWEDFVGGLVYGSGWDRRACAARWQEENRRMTAHQRAATEAGGYMRGVWIGQEWAKEGA